MFRGWKKALGDRFYNGAPLRVQYGTSRLFVTVLRKAKVSVATALYRIGVALNFPFSDLLAITFAAAVSCRAWSVRLPRPLHSSMPPAFR